MPKQIKVFFFQAVIQEIDINYEALRNVFPFISNGFLPLFDAIEFQLNKYINELYQFDLHLASDLLHASDLSHEIEPGHRDISAS